MKDDELDRSEWDKVKAGVMKKYPQLTEDQAEGLARALIKTDSQQAKEMKEE